MWKRGDCTTHALLRSRRDPTERHRAAGDDRHRDRARPGPAGAAGLGASLDRRRSRAALAARVVACLPGRIPVLSRPREARAWQRFRSEERIWGWWWFDWASQPYHTLLVTFVFGPFFATVAAAWFMGTGLDEKAADAEAQALWSLALTITGLIIGFGAPIMGAMADSTGRRRPWILGFLGALRARRGDAVEHRSGRARTSGRC